jgi:formate hydrogenlyase subunit 6/NADH:ubiquinone oxidoreductase subunit I
MSYVIDALRCTECVGAHDEPQCQVVCPTECIVANPDFPETREELEEKYRQLHA